MMISLGFFVALCGVLLDPAAGAANGTVPGISSPDGYIIFEYYDSGSCQGTIYEKRAMALNTCLPPGLRGEPYATDYYIFSNNSEGVVEGRQYTDSSCLNFRSTETFSYNSCSPSGDTVLRLYSAELPELVFDYAIVQQVTYADVTNNDLADCDSQEQVITTSAQYSDGCLRNCLLDYSWKLCTFGCVDSVANMTYFDPKNRTCAADDGAEMLSYTTLATTCENQFSCLVPAPRPTSSDNDDDDYNDIDLTVGGMIGIVVACVFAAVVFAAAPDIMRKRRASKNSETSELRENLMTDA